MGHCVLDSDVGYGRGTAAVCWFWLLPCCTAVTLHALRLPATFHSPSTFVQHSWAGRKLLCGGGGDTEAHFPNPPPPSLAAVTGGGGGSGRGRPTCRAGGGGGVNPTSMAQNNTHIALIILTTQMWGGKLLVEKTFSGQILCSCAFGANIRSYTKQRARHRTPFLQPPTPPSAGVHVIPPPQSNHQVALTFPLLLPLWAPVYVLQTPQVTPLPHFPSPQPLQRDLSQSLSPRHCPPLDLKTLPHANVPRPCTAPATPSLPNPPCGDTWVCQVMITIKRIAQATACTVKRRSRLITNRKIQSQAPFAKNRMNSTTIRP